MKRTLCFLLALVMLFSFAACKSSSSENGNSNGASTKVSQPISIPYSREDGINPFLASSLMNDSIMPLLYAGLFKVDANYNANPDIALSAECSGSQVVVTLNTTRKFSNGITVTATDVVYSFNKAKSSTYYASSLQCITSATAQGSNTVVFTTSGANVYAASMLTFPIVKNGTAESQTDIPIGAGPYVYAPATDGGVLTENTYYNRAVTMQQVSLVNIMDTTTLHYNFVVGNIGAVFDDMSTGESQRLSSGSAMVDLNNLVYIGINCNAGVFTSAALRVALASALDKSELLNSGFEGYGMTTDLPFNPNWYVAKDVKTTEVDTAEAKTYLKNNVGKQTVDILVCNANNFKVKMAETLASQLNSLGINTKIESVSYAVYQSGVAAGNYDLYIGEYKMTNDMNISDLLSGETVIASFASFRAGETSIDDFLVAFNEYQPFVPVCIRYGVLAYTKSVTSSVVPAPNNPFANLKEWFI